MVYVDREVAVKALCDFCNICVMDKRNPHDCEIIVSAIQKLVPAKVKPVITAKWEWDKDGTDWGIGAWRCSNCRAKPNTFWQNEKCNPYIFAGSRFCPNCGATMKGKTVANEYSGKD